MKQTDPKQTNTTLQDTRRVLELGRLLASALTPDERASLRRRHHTYRHRPLTILPPDREDQGKH